MLNHRLENERFVSNIVKVFPFFPIIFKENVYTWKNRDMIGGFFDAVRMSYAAIVTWFKMVERDTLTRQARHTWTRSRTRYTRTLTLARLLNINL